MTQDEFVGQLAATGISARVSAAVHVELAACRAQDLKLHSDDSLQQFL
jgi:hypothetical protein